MSLYLEQIRQLIDLQKVDDHIYTVQKELGDAPREIEQMRAAHADMNAKREKLLEKIDHLKEQAKRIGLEIEDETSRLRRSKNKLMQVANAREYQAMSKEMDNLEKNNFAREKERSTLLEELGIQEAALQEIEGVWSQTGSELSTREEGLETLTAAARAELTKLEQSRSGVGSKIPRPVLDRYEFIRRRLAHPVIVSVHEGICSGCCISIPPQDFIELQSGHKILNCPNCQRLVFWSEHFAQAQQG